MREGEGVIRPVTLVHGSGYPTYRRFSALCWAVCENGVVTWR